MRSFAIDEAPSPLRTLSTTLFLKIIFFNTSLRKTAGFIHFCDVHLTFFKGGNFVKWLNTKSTNSFLSSILLLFIFQCCFLHFVNLLLDDDNPVENRQEPGIQAGVLRAQAARNVAKKVCPFTLCPIWTSLQAISPRVANSLLAFPSDEILPTNRYNQPCINTFPFLYISTSKSTFEHILIQIHTQNYWSRFHDELLFVTFFLDHLCVPPWPPILTWSRVSRSICETSLRSLLLPGWSHHTSVFHL